MNILSRQCLSILTSFTVSVFTVAGGSAFAEEHLVPLSELHGKLHSAADARQKNVGDIERVLSYPAATSALAKYHVSREQMRTAVATLSDAELAHFADRARASEQDVQGGFIIGILALIGLVVVIIIVVEFVAENRPPSSPDGGVEYPGAIPQIAPVNG
jgi:hypothetical protein